MRGILAWLLVTLVAYLAAGLWVGGQLRPTFQHRAQLIVQNVGGVADVLGR